MKYTMIAVVTVVILAAGGFYFYNQSQSNPESMMKKDEAMMEKPDDSMEKTDSSVTTGEGVAMDGVEVMEDKMPGDKMEGDGKMMSEGEYAPFTQAAFDAVSGKKRVLFFYANWCPTCKPADADFSANVSKFPEDLAVFRVNYNDTETDATDKALAQKYGITYQHTFVEVDSSGNEVKKWNGGQTDKLLSETK